jgi:hypothetical protein
MCYTVLGESAMTTIQLDRAWWRAQALRFGRIGLVGLAPLLVMWAEIFYHHFLYQWLYLGPATFGYWLIPLALPPLAGEIAFTRWFEVGRHGWRVWVIAGLVGRLVVLLACFWLLVWMPMQEKGTLGILHPQIGFWPWVTRLAWIASPYLGMILAVPLVALYGLSCRLRIGRFVTAVALPMLATLLLFRVLVFHPTSWWRFSNGVRPLYVE